MIAFDITHTDLTGKVISYEGIYKHSIDAIQDCIKNFGAGKVKVVKKGKVNDFEQIKLQAN